MKLTLEKAQQMMDENGGNLNLFRSSYTQLPDHLTVGGWLNLNGTKIQNSELQKVKYLQDGDYEAGRYLYADRILTLVKKRKQVGTYTLYVGKIKNRNVIYDGTYYAHCATLRDGIADLKFKAAKDRGADQYRHLTLEDEVTLEEAATMYRVITGACRDGTQEFIDDLQEKKERYTIREAIQLTKGRYNSARFEEFFAGECFSDGERSVSSNAGKAICRTTEL